MGSAGGCGWRLGRWPPQRLSWRTSIGVRIAAPAAGVRPMNTAGHSPLFWTYARAFLGQIRSDPAEPAPRLAGALQIRFEVAGFVTAASRTAKNIQLRGTRRSGR